MPTYSYNLNIDHNSISTIVDPTIAPDFLCKVLVTNNSEDNTFVHLGDSKMFEENSLGYELPGGESAEIFLGINDELFAYADEPMSLSIQKHYYK